MRTAAELTARTSAPQFTSHSNTHIVAHPSATIDIGQPRVRGIDANAVHFCGPFLFHPVSEPPPSSFPATSTSPPLTLSRLSDVICLPHQIVLIRDRAGGTAGEEWVLVDASFNSVWERSHHNEIENLRDGVFRLRRSAANFKFLPGCYLYLECFHRRHFGHFIVDVMPMAWAYRHARDLGFGDFKVLVSAAVAEFMLPMLEAAGIPREAIVPLRRPVRCEELLLATKSYLTQGYTSPVAGATWRQVRDALDRGCGPERVYFSRAQTPNRQLTNESAVEALFAARGFRVVHPQMLGIEEQVTLWANARLAAGPAGSNMYGLAFQRRLERSFVVNSPNMVQFAELFLQAGYPSETTMYIGRSITSPIQAPWFVDLEDLAREIDRWVA